LKKSLEITSDDQTRSKALATAGVVLIPRCASMPKARRCHPKAGADKAMRARLIEAHPVQQNQAV